MTRHSPWLLPAFAWFSGRQAYAGHAIFSCALVAIAVLAEDVVQAVFAMLSGS